MHSCLTALKSHRQKLNKAGMVVHCGPGLIWICLKLLLPRTVYIFFSCSPVHTDCIAMTRGYRARPWYGREVLNMTAVSQSPSFRIHMLWFIHHRVHLHYNPNFRDISGITEGDNVDDWSNILVYPLKESQDDALSPDIKYTLAIASKGTNVKGMVDDFLPLRHEMREMYFLTFLSGDPCSLARWHIQ